MTPDDPLISPATLTERMNANDAHLFDATWTFQGGPAIALGAEHTLPGAQVFDIDGLSDPGNDLPHMAPSPDAFAAAMSSMGLRRDDQVVVFDRIGQFSAPRAWWMLRAFGHRDAKVSVLDGGLPAWPASQSPGAHIQHAVPDSRPPTRYPTAAAPQLLATAETVLAAIDDDETMVLDARAPGRFAGVDNEPRPGLRAGHVPGALNIPWRTVLADKAAMKSHESLRQLFEEAGVDLTVPNVITMCGSGVTACLLALALARLGRWDVKVYDGSWAEWGARADLPIVSNAA